MIVQIALTHEGIRQKIEQLHTEALQLEAQTMQRYRSIGEVLETAVSQGLISNFELFVKQELPISESCAYQCRRIYREWDLIEKLVGVTRIGPDLALRALGRYARMDEKERPSLSVAKPPSKFQVGDIVKVCNPTLPFNGQLVQIADKQKLLYFAKVEGSHHRFPLFPNDLEAVDVDTVTMLQPKKRKSRLKAELVELIEQWNEKLPEAFVDRLQELIS